MSSEHPFTIAIDFDGVISDYDKFIGKGKFAKPIEGVVEALAAFKDNGCIIIIHTTRGEVELVGEYLRENKIPFDYINCNPVNSELGLNEGKPIADVYIDDRAITFNGKWGEDFVSEVLRFVPHYKKRRNRPKGVVDRMADAANLFEIRSAQYGEAYLQHGYIMAALFPDGLELKTAEDFNRFGIMNMMVSKLNRYSNNFGNLGHQDSSRDLGVYSFMLEEVDERCKLD